MTSVAIVGGGILGSWTGWSLRSRGFSVTLFEKDETLASSRAASFAAGGLLCPFSELENAEPLIARLGIQSLSLWSEFAKRAGDFYFRRSGTVVAAHPSDLNELTRLRSRLRHLGFAECGKPIDREALRELEPGLETNLSSGLYFPDEGQLDPRGAWASLRKAFSEVGGTLVAGVEVGALEPSQVIIRGEVMKFDWVIDCRGLSAKVDLPPLRGVRGERLTLQTSEVVLNRPIRLLHPHVPLYVAPLENHRFIVGATMLESETTQPITVRSTVEMASAAFSLDTRFAEAEVIETVVGHRPAFSDNLPRIEIQPGLIRMNGLFRHGFLVSPALASEVAQYLSHYFFSEGELCKFA